MKQKFYLLSILSLGLLAGCANQSPAKTTSSQSSSSSRSRVTSSSSSAQVKPTATFSNQTFTISRVAYRITGEKVTASATANRQLFVLYYTVTNHQTRSIVPSDIWQAAVSARQAGKSLGTGNLAFTTSQTQDNNKLNNTVMPLKPGQSSQGLATFEPKGSGSVTVTYQDTHHQTIHQSHYSLN
ncbi:DUF5067 domain-containing protein [Levilactobacillus tangyuanensis]|uniref:DUF5067 domain-containing protein n=1 Tax=Levilactobacillus tangyuanensis TaxID=2486021 RepID=A0ABW1TQ34_9LACO|nr:DUF5067 domain-containing protein [Levilactobacillus tangyuanensis]